MKKKTKSKKKFNFYFYLIIGAIAVVALCVGVGVKINHTDEGTTIVFGEQQVEPTFEGQGDYEDEILTVDEIDGGGKFSDTLNVGEGEDDLYYELGSIEDVDTSSPLAFKNSTIGRCIVANNYYGAQCVSLARAFWWSYAGFDVSTCGTGLAKGMMNCYETNARDKFEVIWDKNQIQEGTWIVLDGASTGHICMALSAPKGNYVSCLGENQGGVACEYGIGGAGTNIINISLKNFIGGYTPIDYIKVPEPAPSAPDTGKVD
ncbi:MAG: hypothetical protein J6S67_11660 [Methanobrevibacter sp.]|nr:hypothetical protein [Methanobrevibacter sp.]